MTEEPEWVPPATTLEAIARVQRGISHIPKGRQAGGGEQYTFRGIDDVVKALHPLLAQEGLVIIIAAQEELRWEEHVPGRKDSWSRLTIRFTFEIHCEHDDDVLTFVGIGIGLDNGDKGPGKALSYAYKSAVSSLFSIPTDDPAMDAEMTPEDPTWWGGWDTPDEHNHTRSKLLERSMALVEPWKTHMRAALEENNILTEEGTVLAKIARWQMNKWDDALESIEFMSGEEPWDMNDEDAAQDEADAKAEAEPDEKPPATVPKKAPAKKAAADPAARAATAAKKAKAKAARKKIADKHKAEVAAEVAAARSGEEPPNKESNN